MELREIFFFPAYLLHLFYFGLVRTCLTNVYYLKKINKSCTNPFFSVLYK